MGHIPRELSKFIFNFIHEGGIVTLELETEETECENKRRLRRNGSDTKFREGSYN